MRDIKFRTYVRFLREMHEVREIIFDKGAVMIDAYQYGLDKDDAPVMQYTGFQDSKGVDIYEGDIVNIRNDGYANVIANVIFDTAAFWLYSEDIFLAYTEDADNMIRLSTIYMDTGADDYLAQLEVIGNIHQNPELLEKK